MGGRHGLEGGPGQSMFALTELFDLITVTFSADIRGWNGCLVHIFFGVVARAMTVGAGYAFLAVFGQLPVCDDVGCYLFVAANA